MLLGRKREPWRRLFGFEASINTAGPVEPALAEPAPAAAGDDPRDRRTAERHETDVAARLRLPASEHDCTIVDLSTGGMSVIAPDAVVFVGQQVAVVTQNFPRLAGIVRWIGTGVFGVQFAQPITQQLIEKMGQLRRRVRLPRAARVRLELPAIVYFEGQRHRVLVGNISVGGMMMATLQPPGRRRAIRRGQALMIEFPDLLPIGGHVRWTCGTQCGVMFSRLLPVPMAEEIQRRCNLSRAWVDDVHQAHVELEAGI